MCLFKHEIFKRVRLQVDAFIVALCLFTYWTMQNNSEEGSVLTEPEQSPELVQKKLYYLLDQLKEMHAQLPLTYQVRIPYEILTELANILVSGTIFEIVQSLMEIQHVTETHLIKLRSEVEKDNEEERQDWLSKIKDPEELENLLTLLKIKHTKTLRETDMKLITILDQKRKDQQTTMHKAGVPGFFETDDTKEIKIQMFLFDFILRLSRIKFDPNKRHWFLQD